jgi:hypothetical protein
MFPAGYNRLQTNITTYIAGYSRLQTCFKPATTGYKPTSEPQLAGYIRLQKFDTQNFKRFFVELLDFPTRFWQVLRFCCCFDPATAGYNPATQCICCHFMNFSS